MRHKYITQENFWDGIEKTNNGCWNMLSIPLNSNGRFGHYRFSGKRVRPSAIAWKVVYGEFPDGELWNTCGNPRCVNPSHYNHIKSNFDRFINKIKYVDENGCWEWTAFRNSQGYGYMKFKDGKNISAHRFSYIYYIGDIPDGADVLHRCDNPSCCNPTHLFLGNDSSNVLDREMKERNPHKLSSKEVIEIREKRELGESVKNLCDEYGILSKKHMYNIINRKSWGWVE